MFTFENSRAITEQIADCGSADVPFSWGKLSFYRTVQNTGPGSDAAPVMLVAYPIVNFGHIEVALPILSESVEIDRSAEAANFRDWLNLCGAGAIRQLQKFREGLMGLGEVPGLDGSADPLAHCFDDSEDLPLTPLGDPYATWEQVTGFATVRGYLTHTLGGFVATIPDMNLLEAVFRSHINQRIGFGLLLEGERFVGPWGTQPRMPVQALKDEVTSACELFWPPLG